MSPISFRPSPAALHRCAAMALAAAAACGQAAAAAQETPASAPAPVATPSAAASAIDTAPTPPSKDIVLDGAAAPVQATTTPATTSPRPPASSVHDAATSGALAELALDLLRQESTATGNAQVNAVVSPVSLASAMGLVHAGTNGTGARELAALLGTPATGQRAFASRLPGMLDRVTASGTKTGSLTMANRVWVDQTVIAAVPASYATLVSQRFHADGAVLPFAQAGASRLVINDWVSQQTARRIPELMPEGSITPTTKVVVTNAIHFKSKWAKPFDPARTAPKPFQVAPGESRLVPTMADERSVRMGTVDNLTVIEIPFSGDQFALLVGMPPAGHTLNALETDLEGLDIAGWSGQLKPVTCRLSMPRFTIAPVSKPLKPTLQALGVKAVFDGQADLSPLLGKAAKGVYLDNVYQSATIVVDELGGEAAAATGAAMVAKALPPMTPPPACAVDRAFVFAVVHKASGAPLFVGKVADPTRS